MDFCIRRFAGLGLCLLLSGCPRGIERLENSAQHSELSCAPIVRPVVHGALGGPLEAPPPVYDWQGQWQQCEVLFPSRLHGSTLYAMLLAPAQFDAERDRLPTVVIVPGSVTGLQSQYQWSARELASNGYIVVVVDPQGVGYSELVSYPQTADNYIDAAASALDFLESEGNPLRDNVDPARIGAAGHSLGAWAVSWLQGEDTRLSAIVAWDNLATSATGDAGTTAGGPFSDAAGSVIGGEIPYLTPRRPARPRVPALGQASDSSDQSDPDIKKIAWNAWRDAGVPSMQLSFLGKSHLDWGQASSASEDSDSGKSRELQMFQYYTRAWFDLWLKGDGNAISALDSREPLGRSLDDVLSAEYHSALYVPMAGIDCEDLLIGGC